MESQSSKNEDESIQQRELPFDLITDIILTRLPIKSIVRFKSVSKLWYSTLSSPRFAFQHYFKFHQPSPTQSMLIKSDAKFQILSYEDNNKFNIEWVNNKVDFDEGGESMSMVLAGTCNGLVCLGSTSGHLFVIWNPITSEFRKYRDNDISKFVSDRGTVTWGFGYVSAVDDYKVVRICKKVFRDSFRIHVYSTRFDGDQGMRRIDDNDSSNNNFSGLRIAERLIRPGVLVNETLYWMGGVPPMIDGLQKKILSFDLASEMFDTFSHLEVSSPSSYDMDDNCFDHWLCVVNGSLSKYGTAFRSGEGVITMLKSPGEIEEILIPVGLRVSMHREIYDIIVGFTGSNKIFTQYYGGGAPCLVVMDLTSQPLNHIPLMTLEAKTKNEIVSYCASLISPDANVRGTHKDDKGSNIV